MTLEEAIKHCEEKSCGEGQCAIEHKQLADWLKELQRLKQQPQGLDEAAEEYAEKNKNEWEAPIESLICGTPRTRTDNDKWEIKEAFKAGAEWMAGQGFISEGIINQTSGEDTIIELNEHIGYLEDCEEVIVNIRKKQ